MADENSIDLSNLTKAQQLNLRKKAKRSRSAPAPTKFKHLSVDPPTLEQLSRPEQVIRVYPRASEHRPRKDPRTGRSRSRGGAHYDTANDSNDYDFDSEQLPGAGTGASFRPQRPPPPRTTDDERWQQQRETIFKQSLRHEHCLRSGVVSRAQGWVASHQLPHTPCASCVQCTQRVLFITEEAAFVAAVPYVSCNGCVSRCSHLVRIGACLHA